MSDDCEVDPGQASAPWTAGADEERERRGDKPPKGGKEPKQKKTKHERANPDYEDFPGYEGAAFIGSNEARPPKMSEARGEAPEMQFGNFKPLTEEECKSALEQFVDSQFCYGSKPAKEMEITSCLAVSAFHYKLETFSENRSTKKKKKPYKSGPVDGPENGEAPLPWDIPCAPEKMFHEDKVKSEVPHTAKVKKCKDCKGRGWETCDDCDGWGKVECPFCDGSGKKTAQDEEGNEQEVDCTFCDGSGEKSCVACGGDGRVTCEDCEGYRKLKCYIRLKVKFINHVDEYILEKTDLPDELIAKAGGTVIYEETNPLIYPIQNFPVDEINQQSLALYQAHTTKWPNEYIHSQRQTLRCVPVTEVAYKWDDENYRFWVYGDERSVYAPDYPQQKCWGCQLL